MQDSYVILQTYDNIFEAELAKCLLEESGILVELKNEMINSIYPTFAGDMYRLELCVPSEQVHNAMDILDTYVDSFLTHKYLKESQALLEGHFQLTSGKHSSRYIEKIKIIQHPQVTSEVCKLFVNRLSGYDPDAIIGPAYGGIVLAFETARQMNKKFIFTQRINEKMTLRSGFDLSEIKKVVVVEDIITTGGSVFELLQCLQQFDIDILAISAIVDRSGGKIDFAVPFIPLLSIDIPSWEVTECELCKNGVPLIKPGSSNKN